MKTRLTALAAGLLTLAACGSTAAAPKTSANTEKEVNAYVECLRKQGLDVPDATVDENGQVSFGQLMAGRRVDREKLQAAQQVCGKPPAGVTSAIENTLNSPEFQDAALKFAKCMRDEGVDIPDPDFSKLGSGDGGGDNGLFGGIDRDDPKVAAGIKACQHVWTEAGIGSRTGGDD